MFDPGSHTVIKGPQYCDSEMAERHSTVENRSPLISQGAQVGKKRIPRFAVYLEKAVEDIRGMNRVHQYPIGCGTNLPLGIRGPKFYLHKIPNANWGGKSKEGTENEPPDRVGSKMPPGDLPNSPLI